MGRILEIRSVTRNGGQNVSLSAGRRRGRQTRNINERGFRTSARWTLVRFDVATAHYRVYLSNDYFCANFGGMYNNEIFDP